jgi:hypothetical protein
MKCDERLFAGLGFDVFENLLLVVDEIVALLACGHCDGWHVALLALAPGRLPGASAILQRTCQSTFCTTDHQNSQFTVNYAFDLEWIPDGIEMPAAKRCVEILCGLHFA